mgnify:CR=1 FL=1
MILVVQQSLFPTKGEESIKAGLKRFKLLAFHSHNGRHLAMAFQPLLIGHREASHADATQDNQPDLCTQCNQAAVKILTIKLSLN